jgi:superfamily II helicase
MAANTELVEAKVVCQHCEYENILRFVSRAHFRRVMVCRKCGKWNWVKVADRVLKGSVGAYSKCPGKCKIGRLEPEIR